MNAGSAYASSLGTTGLLIASSLLLLLVVGSIVAFDAWPHDEPSHAGVVAVGGDEALRGRSATAERQARVRARVAARRRAAAAKRRRARLTAAALSDGSPVELESVDPVISELPAPDSDGTAGTGGGGEAGPAEGDGSSRGGETTRQLGQAVSGVSPQAGTTIGGVGGALDQAIGGTMPSPEQ